jgi:AcrR family transcriptional regulator
MKPRQRANQKIRTRKDLLQAAGQLMREGREPSLEAVAEAAMVSRATAYRYFPSTEALVLEAALDIDMPSPEEVFPEEATADGAVQDGARTADPAARVRRAGTIVHDTTLAHEQALRIVLARALERGARHAPGDAPLRQNRRTPLIEAALAPFRKQFSATGYKRLVDALALVIGTESVFVCKDVLGLSDAEARAAKAFAIDALVAAARRTKGD